MRVSFHIRLSIVAVLGAVLSTSWAAIINVPADYQRIQQAVNNASEGDTVLVADGEYFESITIENHGLTLASHYLLDNDSTHISNTIITPEAIGTRTITVDSTVTTAIVLHGISFQDAQFDDIAGYGSVINAHDIDVTIVGCRFYNNTSRTGAVCLFSCSVSMENNLFVENHCWGEGAAVMIYDGDVYAYGNRFLGNTSEYATAGMGIIGEHAEIMNNWFIDNSCAYLFGALHIGNDDEGVTDSYVVRDNLFEGNTANVAAGMIATDADTLTVFNNTFIHNVAHEGLAPSPSAGAMHVATGSVSAEIYNNEFYYNIAVDFGAVAVFQSDVRFHENLLFKNEASEQYALTAVLGQDNEGMNALVYNNLFFENTRYDPNNPNDFGCVSVNNQTILTAYENDFYGNVTYAAGWNPNSHGDLRVENNYWGHPSGPYHRIQNPDGQGDAVMEEIDVLPFATEPFTTRWLHAPEPFHLVAPEPEDFVTDSTVTFLWRAAADSTPTDTIRYTLELADNPHFEDGITVDAGEDTTATVDNLNWETAYYWRVEARDIYDLTTYSAETWSFIVTSVGGEDLTGIPDEWSLERVYPNPFNRAVQVVVAAPRAGEATVAIYDLQGRLVDTLHRGALDAGRHRLAWTPHTAAGVYFLRATTGAWSATRKLVYLK